MYERKATRPISRAAFIWRMVGAACVAAIIAAVSLAIGMIGYHVLEGFSWLDSFLNAAMILGGMGEIDTVKTEGGKLFAGFYALYSGLWLVASMGIILTPIFHRLMHRFHADSK